MEMQASGVQVEAPQAAAVSGRAVRMDAFYATYHGHAVEHLEQILPGLRGPQDRVVWLAGDSSLDNKVWFSDTATAVNGYERVLNPPMMKQDVCYWLNLEAQRRRQEGGGPRVVAVNTAIEATSLNDRAFGRLLAQDEFLRDRMAPQDVLVVSVGGNDIALCPLLLTVANLAALVCCTPQVVLERCACAHPPNLQVDCGCLGCGVPGCVAGTLAGFPLGFGYFVDLFKNRVESYVRRLVGRTRPRKVVVCMIYFLDEQATGSWADCALSCMCYNFNPAKLQCAIRKVFEWATQRIEVPGVEEVVAFPLFEVLDGKTTGDYCERVEPSPQGGRKMAAALMDAIL